jgi:hypothetical protein
LGGAFLVAAFVVGGGWNTDKMRVLEGKNVVYYVVDVGAECHL